jgi:O-antigen/teichoic acid export membrane protein
VSAAARHALVALGVVGAVRVASLVIAPTNPTSPPSPLVAEAAIRDPESAPASSTPADRAVPVTQLVDPAAQTSTAPTRGFAANVSFALVGDVATKIGWFVTLVIAARVLAATQVAALGVAMALAAILTQLLDSGVSTIIIRDGACDAAGRTRLLRGSLIARIPLVVIVTAGSLLVASRIASDALVGVTLVYAAVSAVMLSLLGVLRAAQNLAVEAAQKLCVGVGAPLLFTAVVLGGVRTATAGMIALTIIPAASILPITRSLRRATTPGAPLTGGWRTLRAAAPFGLMSLAQLVYYRSGTIMLGGWSTASQTAGYTVASTVAFGLLAVPGAITTGLLPRLAADPRRRLVETRRALRWTVIGCVAIMIIVTAGAWLAVPVVFGGGYRAAIVPLVILVAADVLIGVGGVLGTLLIAARRTGIVAGQVVASLAANLACGALLIPRFGADGAAAATLVTELVAVVILIVAAARTTPGLFRVRRRTIRADGASPVMSAAARAVLEPAGTPTPPHPAPHPTPGTSPEVFARLAATLRRVGELRLVVFAIITQLVLLQVWAVRTNYGLRVTSDTPTFIALLRGMAIHPFAPQSPFLPNSTVHTSHATPYMQLLAFGWDAIAKHDPLGNPVVDPIGAYHYLGVIGIGVTLALLHAIFRFARSQASSRVAWITLPVLLALLGPAEVIWATDWTFHGFLYDGYFPQNVAMVFALHALVTLDHTRHTQIRPTPQRLAALVLLCAATLITHPFTGVLLALLVCGESLRRVVRREPGGWTASIVLPTAFATASAWPAYSLDTAIADTGIRGVVFITICAAATPIIWLVTRIAPRRRPRLATRLAAAITARDTPALLERIAWISLQITALLAVWLVIVASQPNQDPLVTTNRTALYWVTDQRWWIAMFAAGYVGVIGLLRLARRGATTTPLWFVACAAVGLAGAAAYTVGISIPVWYRFLLLCQIPLALGAAVILAEAPTRRVRQLVVGTLIGSVGFRIATLVLLPATITYFNNPIQTAYALAPLMPAGTGAVITDPFTSYFIPAATGNPVFSITQAHVGSPAEKTASANGYQLIHTFFMGAPGWRDAARTLYQRGARYVLIQDQTLLAAPDLQTFSTGLTPIYRTDDDFLRRRVYTRNVSRIATLVWASAEYRLYRLDQTRVFAAAAPSPRPNQAPLVPNPSNDVIPPEQLTLGFPLNGA